jgi:lipid A 3-O-deacylase
MKMHNLLPALGLAVASATGFGAASASAADLTAAIGMTGQGQMTWRAGISQNWNKQWWQSNRGYLSGYWEAGYTYWEGGDQGSGAHSLSFSPVFVYQFNGERFRPFIEAGIGVSLFSSSKVADRNMGSAFQFEDRLGAGFTLHDGSRLGIRAIHYSNAGIKNPNDGIESYSLFYTKPF